MMDARIMTASLLALVLVLVPRAWQAFKILLWRPYVLTKAFERQGIRGPPYKLLYGSLPEIKRLKKAASDTVLDRNSNDIIQRVLPAHHKWASEYGETFLYWNGTEPRLVVTEPEIVKQILSNKFGYFEKPKLRPEIYTLAGRGLVLVEGLDWVRHKRILNPAFSMDKLKMMTTPMADCTQAMLEEWKKKICADGDPAVEVTSEFQKLTADIIAHTAFGSSYAEGIEVFKAQRELQKCCAASITDIFIPGTQYLPTPSNLQIWKLDRKVKSSVRKMIETRLNSRSTEPNSGYGDDLLGLMIAALHAEGERPKMKMDEIVEECKTFFFAGHETTSTLLTWAMMLLSLHQDWQEELRKEVMNECGNRVPDADKLSKLKLMSMVLLETLRLYPSALVVTREATQDMKVGHLTIPKAAVLFIPIAMMHRRKDLWGQNASEFDPTRYKAGASMAAKHPNALVPFSMGPRSCIGQNFAMLEVKTVLALILQRFRFGLSPKYRHAPMDFLTLQPQYGLPVVFKPLG